MRYRGDSELQDLGYVGDVVQGVDGHLYQWVEGLDADGQEMGFWAGVATPEPAVAGLGALYAAPDGTLYQVHGLDEGEEAPADGAAPAPAPGAQPPPAAAPPGGPPRPGMRAAGRRRRPQAPGRPGGAAAGPGGRPRRKGGLLRALLPVAKFATRFIPGVGPIVSAGIDVASKLVKPRGVAGLGGLGALYAAPDGTVYQVAGVDEDLQGLAADELAGEALYGFEAADDLRGDEDLRGYAYVRADDELRGDEALSADDELRGDEALNADDELRGDELRGDESLSADPVLVGEEPLGEEPLGDLQAYVPTPPPRTPRFVRPAQLPHVWKPLW